MVVGGGEGRGNSVGGSKRSSMGVDQSGVSFGLTLDNMLDWTILGNIFWAKDTIGHSSVVVGVVVAGDSGGGNMAVRVGSSSISGSVRVSIAVDKSWVSLSLALGKMSVGESADEGGGVCTIN